MNSNVDMLRLEALRKYEILDAEREPAFDDIVEIGCSIVGAPAGMITFLDVERQWFLSESGVGARETPLEGSFCAVAMAAPDILVVEDTHADPLWAMNPFVTASLEIRFYAGVPLITPDGVRIGALCVFDRKPRKVEPEKLNALKALARQVISLLETRTRAKESAKKEFANAVAEQDAALKLQVAQEQLAAMAENSAEFIGMCDMNGSLFYGNPAALSLVGMSNLEEFKATPLPEFFFPEDRDFIIGEFLPRVLRDGRAETEIRLRHFVTGAAVWVAYRVFVLKNGNGLPLGLATVSRDLTAERLSDAALVESAKLAAVGRLASSIAHEINNPLEAVTNLLFLIGRDEALSQTSRDFLDTAERELARASQLTSQTLRFHRQSTAATRIRPQFILGEVLNLFHSRLQNRYIDIIQDYGEDTWLTCFEGDIRQVLNNMISNAIDAMANGGTLTIRTRKVIRWSDGTRGVRITIADTGAGMNPEELAQMFDAFYTTKGIGGTGLGLWISYRIVHKHRGFVRAYSSVKAAKRGTTIMLWLPEILAPTAGEQWNV